ncbi:MAG: kbaY [Thermomicrobiales bacterium]|nr:kbaY [Thermomicrobiales bacterium]
MALTSGREVLSAARAGGYAVPAFNIFNLEMLQAALGAAEVERAPVIVQIKPAFDRVRWTVPAGGIGDGFGRELAGPGGLAPRPWPRSGGVSGRTRRGVYVGDVRRG